MSLLGRAVFVKRGRLDAGSRQWVRLHRLHFGRIRYGRTMVCSCGAQRRARIVYRWRLNG